MGEYRTIVADPPWQVPATWPIGRLPRGAVRDERRTALRYPTMPVAEIARLPIYDLAAADAHLYLWVVNRFLPHAFVVAKAWGFRPVQTLVWAKTPMGLGPGGAFAPTVEFCLFARRGKEIRQRRADSMWFNWPRQNRHSRKPEAFYDLVEQVSPGPYLELFARRQRLGWSVWGNEVESTIALAAD